MAEFRAELSKVESEASEMKSRLNKVERVDEIKVRLKGLEIEMVNLTEVK